jgi:hypothetical protein
MSSCWIIQAGALAVEAIANKTIETISRALHVALDVLPAFSFPAGPVMAGALALHQTNKHHLQNEYG